MATILVADDRPVDRQLIVTLMGYAGHRILEASSGVEALRLAAEEHPDLVITDVLMPQIDGFEFVRRLRDDPATAGILVIFYTATYHEEEARDLAECCGVARVLVKPTEPAVILQTVSEVLGAPALASVSGPPADFDQAHRSLLTGKLVQREQDLMAVNDRLSGLVKLGLDLSSEASSENLARMSCRAARDLLQARHAVLAVDAGDGLGTRIFEIGEGDAAASASPGAIPSRRPVVDILAAQRKALRCHGAGTRRLGLTPAPESFLGTSVASPSRGYGWLYVEDKITGEPFGEEDEDLAVTLASQFAVAYENALRFQLIQDYAHQLERRVAETQEALRVRDEFLSIAAHELKTPLTGLIGAVQLARRFISAESQSPVSPKLSRLLGTIERQSKKFGGLISHLLDVTRLDGGTLTLYKHPTDLEQLIEGIVSEARLSADRHTIALRTQGSVRAEVDAARIEQVLRNLLDNAVKFSSAGGPIEVELAATLDRRVRVAVRDHGIGVPPEKRNGLFKRYSQAHSGDHRSGLGLGLFICRSIVELHGGQIVAEHPPDGGTRFVITMPVASTA